MFESFSTTDFVILGSLCMMNLACILCIVFLIAKTKKKNKSKPKKTKSVLDKPEVKVTKVNEEETKASAFDEIMEAMQKDLEAKEENPIKLFEQEQEEKAIISYQELLNAKNKAENKFKESKNNEQNLKKEVTEVEKQPKQEKEEPKFTTTKESRTTIEREARFTTAKEPKPTTIKETNLSTEKELPKQDTTDDLKFNNSEFVSPVFGRVSIKKPKREIKEELVDSHELEKTLNIKPLTDEIKKNNEFLDALKEFRKNL